MISIVRSETVTVVIGFRYGGEQILVYPPRPACHVIIYMKKNITGGNKKNITGDKPNKKTLQGVKTYLPFLNYHFFIQIITCSLFYTRFI
jgi:hypothetical protein